MNADAIAAIAAAGAPGVRIEVVAQTGSTNADLLARVDGLEHNVLLVAERQSAGRGRAGRRWLSSEGGSLTFSLAWHFDGALATLAGLPLAVGVALAESLASLAVKVELKWPNDLLKDGAKLAGVLIETQAGSTGGTWAVIGVGLNLALPDALEAQIERPVANAPWLANMERDALVATLLVHLDVSLRQFAQGGFAAFSGRWNHLHAYQGQAVTIIDRGVTLHEGVAAGVDGRGALLLDTAGGRVTIVAGDVSLRPAHATGSAP